MENKAIHISAITIEGYKCFAELKIEKFSIINLIVGQNAIGKTTLLHALQDYADENKIKSSLIEASSVYIPKEGDDHSNRYPFVRIVNAIKNNKDGCVFVDMIDINIEPDNFFLLWRDILYKAEEYNCQVFATTHSTECIKEFALQNGCTGNELLFIELYRDNINPDTIIVNTKNTEKLLEFIATEEKRKHELQFKGEN